MTPQEFSEFTRTLVTYPLAAVVVALAFAVIYLFRRLSALEKEFREYISAQGAETKSLLDRAVKAIERLEALIDRIASLELRPKN